MMKTFKVLKTLVEKVKDRFPIVRKVEAVPTILKTYYQEAISVAKLRSVAPEKKSRRDVELERRASRELGYVAASGAIFFIPMVGAPFIMVQMLFPRYLLTTGFWSDEERLEILTGIYKDYQPFRDQLRGEYLDDHLMSFDNKMNEDTGKKNYDAFVAPHGPYSFEIIANEHLRLLTYASATVPTFFPKLLVNMIPKFLLVGIYRKYAAEILKDDTLLLAEMKEESAYLDAMSLGELQFAVYRRGGVPSNEEGIMREFLRVWLRSSAKIINGLSAENIAGRDPETLLSSYVVHACALPEIHANVEQSKQ